MAKITIPNKTTGNTFSADEFNTVKTVVNGIDDAATAAQNAASAADTKAVNAQTTADAAQADATQALADAAAAQAAASGKQDALISGTNLKTLNGESLLGAGNIAVTGGGPSYVHNVKTDYGAVGDGVADDTAAIQAAIQAAFDAGGGVVFFPNGKYFIGGAVDAQSNAQIYMPLNSYSDSANLRTIKLMGEVSTNMYANPFESAGSNTPAQKGVILESNLLAAGDVIGSRTEAVSWGQFNFLHVQMENICVRVRSKTGTTDVPPQATGINMNSVTYFNAAFVEVSTTSQLHQTQLPAATAYGIRMPKTNNFVFCTLRSCFAYGMRVGFDAYEHTRIDGCFADVCYIGLKLNPVNHSIHVDNMCIARSRTNIQVVGGSYFAIDNVSFEDDPNGVVTTPGWNHTVYDLEETAGTSGGQGVDGIARGVIRYHRVRSNYGTDYGLFSRNTANFQIGLLKVYETATVTVQEEFPAAGLLAYWSFEEATGDYLDQSGNSRSATRVGTISTATGKVGLAAILEAANDEYLNAGATGLSAVDGALTIAGWFQIKAHANAYQVLLQKGSGATLEYNLYHEKATNLIKAQLMNGNTVTHSSGLNRPLTPSTSWVFVVMEYGSGQFTLQLNNGTAASVAVQTTPLVGGAGNLLIGSNGVAGNAVDGGVDELGMWGRVLTSAEKTYLYNTGLGRTM